MRQAPWAQECGLLTFPFVRSRAGLALPSRSRMDALPAPPLACCGAWGCWEPRTLLGKQTTFLPFQCFLPLLPSTFNVSLVWGF